MRWGFRNGAEGQGWKPQCSVELATHGPVELAIGEHPHSRRDDDLYAKVGGEIVGFAGANPVLSIEVREENYLKESFLSGDEVRSRCLGVVRANGHPVLRLEVTVKPADGCTFPPWAYELEDPSLAGGEDVVPLHDERITWFRDRLFGGEK